MPRPPIRDSGPQSSDAYAYLLLQEALPPYELDPKFCDPKVRKRVGEVISKAMEQRFRRYA
jgi:hypothetical protein